MSFNFHIEENVEGYSSCGHFGMWSLSDYFGGNIIKTSQRYYWDQSDTKKTNKAVS